MSVITLSILQKGQTNNIEVASYLSKGNDITPKVHMDHLVSWNLEDSKAGKALLSGGWYYPFDA
jgi:hypothetical protein